MAASKVRVISPDREALTALATRHGWQYEGVSGGLVLTGPSPAEVGAAAHGAHLELHGLSGEGMALEEVFLKLTHPVPEEVPA